MKKPKKFTFKIHRPEGKWKSFFNASMDILLDKNCVGGVYQNKMASEYEIRFQIMKSEVDLALPNNNPWKWVTLKHRVSSFVEAKEFVNKNFEAIFAKTLRKYDL